MQSCAADPFEGALQCSALPTMVANTHALDIIQVCTWLAMHAVNLRTWATGTLFFEVVDLAFQTMILDQAF